MAESKVDIAGRGEALFQEVLHRLQDEDDLVLNIHRAPTPDEPFGNLSTKGRVAPELLRALLHRDNVDMGHQQYGLEAFVAPFPTIEETVAVDDLPLQSLMGNRESLLQVIGKLLEGSTIRFLGVGSGDCGDLNRSGQPLCRLLDIDLDTGLRFHGIAPRTKSGGPPQKDCCQDDNCCQDRI